MFFAGDCVRVVKISSNSLDDNVEPPENPLPNSYEVEGYLIHTPRINTFLSIARYRRNDKEIHGLFKTSVIKDIKVYQNYALIKTINSTYRLELVEDFKEN